VYVCAYVRACVRVCVGIEKNRKNNSYMKAGYTHTRSRARIYVECLAGPLK